MTLALGIDVGTSNAKVVLVDHDGSLLASAERPLETVRDGDAVTQDAEALWQLVLAAAGEVLDAVPGAARAVGAVGCCSQYSSIVPVDGDGRPTAPMRTYFDRRGTQRCYDVLRDHPEAFATWTERHGLPPVGNRLSLGHLLHPPRRAVGRRRHRVLPRADGLRVPLAHRRAAPRRPRCSRHSCATTARWGPPTTTTTCAAWPGCRPPCSRRCWPRATPAASCNPRWPTCWDCATT
ncbi:MAG: FGGY family carbohydrate kinase [Acidimicrobiales bacterium]